MNHRNTTPNRFTRYLRHRRLELAKTQRQVADAIGIRSADFVGLVESGRRRFELDRLPRLAAVLEVDPRQLCAMALREWAPRLAQQLWPRGSRKR